MKISARLRGRRAKRRCGRNRAIRSIPDLFPANERASERVHASRIATNFRRKITARRAPRRIAHGRHQEVIVIAASRSSIDSDERLMAARFESIIAHDLPTRKRIPGWVIARCYREPARARAREERGLICFPRRIARCRFPTRDETRESCLFFFFHSTDRSEPNRESRRNLTDFNRVAATPEFQRTRNGLSRSIYDGIL